MSDELPDHGRPTTDNLPPDVDALPVMPLAISDAEAAFELAERAEAAGKEMPADLPYDAEKAFAFRLRVNAFADAAGAWKEIKVIKSQAQAERLTDFVRGAQELEKQIEEQRKAEKKPWDDKADAVHAIYKPLSDAMKLTAAWMKPMAAAWLDAEAARKRAEAAEQKRIADEQAAEAARQLARAEASNDVMGMIEAEASRKAAADLAKAAAAPIKAKMGSASGGGRAMSMRTQAYAEITNQNAVYMAFREHPKVVDLLQSLADEAMRSGKGCPGAERKERSIAA